MTEESKKKFILLIIGISQAVINFNDDFFKEKLSKRLNNLIEAYLQSREFKVAQDNKSLLLLNQLDSLLEDIDYIIHLNTPNTFLLLHLKQTVLSFKLDTLKYLKSLKKSPKEAVGNSLKANIDSGITAKKRLSPTQDKIMKFIKKTNKARAKDVIGEFSTLSERTIQRMLKELIEIGVLKKEENDRVIFYSLHSN